MSSYLLMRCYLAWFFCLWGCLFVCHHHLCPSLKQVCSRPKTQILSQIQNLQIRFYPPNQVCLNKPISNGNWVIDLFNVLFFLVDTLWGMTSALHTHVGCYKPWCRANKSTFCWSKLGCVVDWSWPAHWCYCIFFCGSTRCYVIHGQKNWILKMAAISFSPAKLLKMFLMKCFSIFSKMLYTLEELWTGTTISVSKLV